MEVKGEVGGIVVIDDFAHHPTAIAETLRAVRQRYPGRRVWCVLEPRSWSLRRNVFQDKLASAFDHADEIVLAEVFGAEQVPSEERLDPARLVADLARRGRPARFLPAVPKSICACAAAWRDRTALHSKGPWRCMKSRSAPRSCASRSGPRPISSVPERRCVSSRPNCALERPKFI